MKGYVREYRAGKWSYTVYVGKVDGKPKRKEKGGFTSRKECELALAKTIVELEEQGEVFKPSNKTVAEIYEEYIAGAGLSLKRNSIILKKSMWKNHVESDLGHRPIKAVKTSELDDFLISKREHLSAEYVFNIRLLILNIFKFAVRRKYIKSDPSATMLKIAVNAKPLAEIFTADEIKTILGITKDCVSHSIVMIGIYTGMRISEIIALRWSDIDFKTKQIDINKQLARYERELFFMPCKRDSARIIKIPDVLVDYLKQKQQEDNEARRLMGSMWEAERVHNDITGKNEIVSDFVNIGQTGKVLTKYAADTLKPICARYGIKFKPHKMRHTHCTQLLEAGASVKMVQERLGHKSPAMIMKVYASVSQKHEEDVVAKIPVFM